MTPSVFQLLKAACEGKKPDDYVLTRENGKRVREFRRIWQNLCVRAGVAKLVCRKCDVEAEPKLDAAYQCPKCKTAKRSSFRCKGLLVHDMRRSAARALRRAGVPESVIMKTGGWKTREMFERYNIVNSADGRDAMEALLRSREAEKSLNSALIATSDGGEPKSTATRKPQ